MPTAVTRGFKFFRLACLLEPATIEIRRARFHGPTLDCVALSLSATLDCVALLCRERIRYTVALSLTHEAFLAQIPR